jgi:hypothetical protein
MPGTVVPSEPAVTRWAVRSNPMMDFASRISPDAI